MRCVHRDYDSAIEGKDKSPDKCGTDLVLLSCVMNTRRFSSNGQGIRTMSHYLRLGSDVVCGWANLVASHDAIAILVEKMADAGDSYESVPRPGITLRFDSC